MVSSCSRRRTIAVREDYSLARIERDRLAARLRTRALLDEQQFPAFEIAPAPAERAGELKRKGNLAVQILMQAVVAALLVAKDQRRWFGLSMRGADFQKFRECVWIRIARAHPLGPPIRCRRELTTHRDAQLFDQRRHRPPEILVFPYAAVVTLHHNAAAK